VDAIKDRVIESTATLGSSGESAVVTALVERAKGGDPGAFDDLMGLYERRVIGIGVQMGLSVDDSLDACQETFLKVFRYIGRFRSGESFFKWLYRIAIHSIYDQMGRGRRPSTVSLDDLNAGEFAQAADPGAAVGPRLENADLARKIVAGLDCLTRRERVVFVLRDLQEIDTDRIGRILGLSRVTVRRHCMSARQKLRERLFPPNP
jgi:RNA polymerase sigma-70 factor (ECF subfamily)